MKSRLKCLKIGEWSRLQTICYPITDGTHKTPTYSDSGYIFLSAKNITTGKINWNDIMYIPKSLHDELYSRVSPKMNDILLAKMELQELRQ